MPRACGRRYALPRDRCNEIVSQSDRFKQRAILNDVRPASGHVAVISPSQAAYLRVPWGRELFRFAWQRPGRDSGQSVGDLLEHPALLQLLASAEHRPGLIEQHHLIEHEGDGPARLTHSARPFERGTEPVI